MHARVRALDSRLVAEDARRRLEELGLVGRRAFACGSKRVSRGGWDVAAVNEPDAPAS